MRYILSFAGGAAFAVVVLFALVALAAEPRACAAALALAGPLGTLTGAESASASGLSWQDWLALQVAAERC